MSSLPPKLNNNLDHLDMAKAVEERIKKQRLKEEIDKEKIKKKAQDNDSEKVNDDCHYSTREVIEHLYANEDGDARLLIDRCKGKFCYDHSAQEWYYWNDHYWRLDKINNVINSIQEVIWVYGTIKNRLALIQEKAKKRGDEAKEKSCKKNIEELSKRINSLRGMKRKKSVIAIAKSGVNSLAIPGDEWDKNDMLLGCKNGVIDLNTGIIRDGRPDDWIKTVAMTRWEGINEPCPLWDQFNNDIFNNDTEMVEYIQRLFGYGITGSVEEHIFPIFWGEKARNGKGTLLETLGYVLSDIAYKAPRTFLIESKNNNPDAPEASSMALKGCRIAWCSETNEGFKLDLSKTKELTGGDTVSARIPHAKKQSQFKATHLLIMLTNRKPIATGDDNGLWDRMNLVSFEISFKTNPDPDNPLHRKRDKKLPEKLKKEASGILAWLVRGCLAWQKIGIMAPEKIVAATKEYQSEEDIISIFVDDCCVLDALSIEPAKSLYSSYENWCADTGRNKMNSTNFGKKLGRKFKKKSSNGIKYEGIRII